MKPNEIRTVFDYNFWAFERVWKCVAELSDDQFVEAIDYSTGSIRNIIIHMMSATHRWIKRLQGAEVSPHLSFEKFNTLVETKTKWDEMRSEVLDYLSSLTQGQLNEPVHWKLPARGLNMNNQRWEILLHVANHATDHRAQILAMLSLHFRLETIEQDMIFYLAERSKKHPTSSVQSIVN